jgi:uncharacterized membrane protein YjfL (UPF0719 family)
MSELTTRLLDASGLVVLYQPEALLYVAVIVGLLWLGKQVYARTVGYDLMAAMAESDNKSATLAFCGFLFGLGLALSGALTAHGLPDLGRDLLDLFGFGLLAIALLHLGHWVTQHLAFPHLPLRQHVERGNLAAGLTAAGGHVTTGLILRGALGLGGLSLPLRIVETLVFFALGQLAFVLFARVHQRVLRYSLAQELERGNSAAGLSEALTYVGQGIMLSYATREAHSLPLFLVWFVLSSVLLVLLRLFVDRLLLPGHSLDQEISRDQNWGVALLEGAAAVVVSLILISAF